MKQTTLFAIFALIFSFTTLTSSGQAVPSFITGAYRVEKIESITHFEVNTSEEDTKHMVEQLQNCGPYIHASYIKTEGGFLISLRIQDQTGPEYVAKLMMVLGVTHYTWNNELKTIDALESDLLKS